MENNLKSIVKEALNTNNMILVKKFKFPKLIQILTEDEIDRQYVGFREEKLKLFEK